MKNIIKLTLIVAFLILNSQFLILKAQVGINSDGASPDASAMLDITSDDKGVLIPRLSTNERTSISSPATGLLVYDTYEQSFWYYNGSEWIEITPKETETETETKVSQSPAFITSVDIGSRPVDIEQVGNYLYSLDQTQDKIKVYDISNPIAPTLVSSLSISSTYFQQMAIDGNYLYAISSSGTNDFYVVDISDPTNISLVGGFDMGSSLSEIEISNGYAYVVNFTGNTNASYVTVIDISTPSSPTQVSQLAFNVNSAGDESIVIEGNYLYFIHLNSGNNLAIIDISIPTSPTLISDTDLTVNGDGATEVVKIEDYLYYSHSQTAKIQIVDVSTPTSPISIGNFANEASFFTITNNYLFSDNSALGNYDMEVYDISSTNSPSLLYSIDKSSTSFALDMMVVSDYLYSAEYDGNLYIYQIATQNTQVGDNWISNDGDNEGIIIDDNGKVGIGRSPQTNLLEVEGDASKSSAGDWLANSDARLKKNIEPLHAQTTLAQLLNLQGVTYEWNDSTTGTKRPEGIQYGFTAQNIQTVFPTLVEEDAKGYLQTAYGTYDAMYVEALRALNDENTILKNRVEELESQVAKISQLEQQNAEMKAMLEQIQVQLSKTQIRTTQQKNNQQ